jgi:hypothetical protein
MPTTHKPTKGMRRVLTDMSDIAPGLDEGQGRDALRSNASLRYKA